jgi:uncharacterized protein YukE
MADPLGVTPDELRTTSRDLADVSSRMKDALSSLQGKLGGEGSAWGDDDIGHEFADGGNKYLAQADWVKGSIDAKTKLLDDYAEGLGNAANSFENADTPRSS